MSAYESDSSSSSGILSQLSYNTPGLQGNNEEPSPDSEPGGLPPLESVPRLMDHDDRKEEKMSSLESVKVESPEPSANRKRRERSPDYDCDIILCETSSSEKGDIPTKSHSSSLTGPIMKVSDLPLSQEKKERPAPFEKSERKEQSLKRKQRSESRSPPNKKRKRSRSSIISVSGSSPWKKSTSVSTSTSITKSRRRKSQRRSTRVTIERARSRSSSIDLRESPGSLNLAARMQEAVDESKKDNHEISLKIMRKVVNKLLKNGVDAGKFDPIRIQNDDSRFIPEEYRRSVSDWRIVAFDECNRSQWACVKQVVLESVTDECLVRFGESLIRVYKGNEIVLNMVHFWLKRRFVKHDLISMLDENISVVKDPSHMESSEHDCKDTSIHSSGSDDECYTSTTISKFSPSKMSEMDKMDTLGEMCLNEVSDLKSWTPSRIHAYRTLANTVLFKYRFSNLDEHSFWTFPDSCRWFVYALCYAESFERVACYSGSIRKHWVVSSNQDDHSCGWLFGFNKSYLDDYEETMNDWLSECCDLDWCQFAFLIEPYLRFTGCIQRLDQSMKSGLLLREKHGCRNYLDLFELSLKGMIENDTVTHALSLNTNALGFWKQRKCELRNSSEDGSTNVGSDAVKKRKRGRPKKQDTRMTEIDGILQRLRELHISILKKFNGDGNSQE